MVVMNTAKIVKEEAIAYHDDEPVIHHCQLKQRHWKQYKDIII